MNAIREVEGIPLLSNLAATYAMEVYRHVLETYMPGELENYRQKYLTEWRARFRQQFSFDIRPAFQVI